RASRLGFVEPGHALLLGGDLVGTVSDVTGGRGVDAVYIVVGANAGTAAVAAVWPALSRTAAVNLYGGFPAESRLPVGSGDVVAVHPLRSTAAHQWVDNPAGGRAVLLGNRGGLREHLVAAAELFRAGTGREL